MFDDFNIFYFFSDLFDLFHEIAYNLWSLLNIDLCDFLIGNFNIISFLKPFITESLDFSIMDITPSAVILLMVLCLAKKVIPIF